MMDTKKATSMSLLVALGVSADGPKILLAVKNMGGESGAAWRTLLDDPVARALKTLRRNGGHVVLGAAGLRVFSDWGRQSQAAPALNFRDRWLFVPAGYSLLFAVGAQAAA